MRKRFLGFALAILLLGLFALPVAAATSRADFEYLESERDVVIQVAWPTEQPTVLFHAPDGEVYDPLEEREDTVTTLGEKSLYYVIYNAPAGQWQVEYDKGRNAEIEIAMFDYQPGLSIQSLELGEIANDRLAVTFHVAHPENKRYEYILSVVTEKNGAEKELRSSSSTANKNISVDLRLDDLPSHDAYMLKLYVWFTENETDYFDQVFSEPFAYTNANMAPAMEDFTCIVEPDTWLVHVSWPLAEWSAEEIMVAIFEDDGDEPTFFDSYDPDLEGVQLSYDPGASKIRVEVSVMEDGVYTPKLVKTAEFSKCGLSLEDITATNMPQILLSYTGLSQQSTSVRVNESWTELVLDGDGQVSVRLTDGWNDVTVEYADQSNLIWRLARQIYVDRDAPVLRISEEYDGMETAATSIDLLGTVLDFQTLTVNGEPVTPDELGTFAHTVPLASGENQIEVVAADALGNESRYNATILCTAGGYAAPETPTGPGSGTEPDVLERFFHPDSYLWLILGSVLGILVIGYALIFWRRRGGGN